jgi:hypothetical protein
MCDRSKRGSWEGGGGSGFKKKERKERRSEVTVRPEIIVSAIFGLVIKTMFKTHEGVSLNSNSHTN